MSRLESGKIGGCCMSCSRYHHLNHYAMFGGGYKSGAESIMRKLIKKYGDGTKTMARNEGGEI